MNLKRVLIVKDEAHIAELLCMRMRDKGCVVARPKTSADLVAMKRFGKPSVTCPTQRTTPCGDVVGAPWTRRASISIRQTGLSATGCSTCAESDQTGCTQTSRRDDPDVYGASAGAAFQFQLKAMSS